MTKHNTRLSLMLGLAALGVIPAVSNAQITVTSVKVTVGNAGDTAVYCDTSLHCNSTYPGGVEVWTLPAGGQPVGVGETLVLAQTGLISGVGGNFDTSDRVRSNTNGFLGPYLKGCTQLDPCTVTVEINGTQVYSQTSSPLDAFNNDNDNNEFTPWTLAATQPHYTLSLGYADNAHAAGGGFPTPFANATHFFGEGVPNEFPCTAGCYDSGALLITGVGTPFTGCTVTQGGWGAAPHGNNPGAFLVANFPTATGVTVGGSPYFLHFSSALSVRNFLPQGGTPGALTASATNPTAGTSAGVFAGQVLALALNVQLKGLGSLVLTGTGTSLDGQTVAQVLAAANLALSGGALPAGFTFSSLNNLVDQLNNAFDGCVATDFAKAHLI